MNLQPYRIYMYIYLYKKQAWPEVKATYKVVRVNFAHQNNYKMKITRAFLNHLSH